ncbi:3-dehydroquinate synthase [Thalassospira mesophila]|uniref:3-dehydroquinate synthase n=1 Tax=Thalassospira mesophila TaxID=1293891 RepID=UPI000A1F1715|nr:3-dehydroquinate synthase [Thalassospira mesophila]
MNSAETLRVDLGSRSYDIVIGSGLLPDTGTYIAPFVKPAGVVIITDENVARLHLPTVEASLDQAGIARHTVIVPAGEASKSFACFENVVEQVLARGIERSTLIIALGGGVIGDLAGYVAASLLRGLDFVQIPTTLLSQVDSSVGGKTGINSKSGKNLVGAFHQPRLVLADTAVLDTLPKREIVAGYGEVAKYGLIDDADFFDWLEINAPAVIATDGDARRQAVLRSCAAKARIVSQDERETGKRALLNLGHTFGHSFEAELAYDGRLLHGEAVAIGMIIAHDVCAAMGMASAQETARIISHFNAVGLPVKASQIAGVHWDVDRLISHMARDKKVRDGQITFVMTRGIGKAFTSREMDVAKMRAAITRSCQAA